MSGMLFEKTAAGRLPPQVRFPAVLTSAYLYALPAAVLEGFPGGTDLLPSVFLRAVCWEPFCADGAQAAVSGAGPSVNLLFSFLETMGGCRYDGHYHNWRDID